jgi:hypothetical protein
MPRTKPLALFRCVEWGDFIKLSVFRGLMWLTGTYQFKVMLYSGAICTLFSNVTAHTWLEYFSNSFICSETGHRVAQQLTEYLNSHGSTAAQRHCWLLFQKAFKPSKHRLYCLVAEWRLNLGHLTTRVRNLGSVRVELCQLRLDNYWSQNTETREPLN